MDSCASSAVVESEGAKRRPKSCVVAGWNPEQVRCFINAIGLHVAYRRTTGEGCSFESKFNAVEAVCIKSKLFEGIAFPKWQSLQAWYQDYEKYVLGKHGIYSDRVNLSNRPSAVPDYEELVLSFVEETQNIEERRKVAKEKHDVQERRMINAESVITKRSISTAMPLSSLASSAAHEAVGSDSSGATSSAPKKLKIAKEESPAERLLRVLENSPESEEEVLDRRLEKLYRRYDMECRRADNPSLSHDERDEARIQGTNTYRRIVALMEQIDKLDE